MAEQTVCPTCSRPFTADFILRTDHLARCAAAPSPGHVAAYSGVLSKRGEHFRTWNSRFCVVSCTARCFCKYSTSAPPKSCQCPSDDLRDGKKRGPKKQGCKSYSLVGCTVNLLPADKGFPFILNIAGDHAESMIFRTATEAERTRWVMELEYARSLPPSPSSPRLRRATEASLPIGVRSDIVPGRRVVSLSPKQNTEIDAHTRPDGAPPTPPDSKSESKKTRMSRPGGRQPASKLVIPIKKNRSLSTIMPGGRMRDDKRDHSPPSPKTSSTHSNSHSPNHSPSPRALGSAPTGWDLARAEGLDGQDEALEHVDVDTMDVDIPTPDEVVPIRPAAPKLSDFEIKAKIGRGGFARVFLVKRLDSGKHYAMKVINKKEIEEGGFTRHARDEKSVLTSVRHPFIVRLHYAFQSVEKLYMVLDFVNGGELYSHLRREVLFSESRARLYVAEIALALNHLHNKGIIYRDLKPENVLLDQKGHIRITDFGLVKKTDGAMTKTLCGSKFYLAPEMVRGHEYGTSVDWWALGIMAFEFLTGNPPFADDDTMLTYWEIVNSPVPVPDELSPQSSDFILKILERDTTKRLGCGSFVEFQNHPFFAGLDWGKVLLQEMEPEFVPRQRNMESVAEIDTKFLQSQVQPSDLAFTPLRSQSDAFVGFTYIREFDSQGLLPPESAGADDSNDQPSPSSTTFPEDPAAHVDHATADMRIASRTPRTATAIRMTPLASSPISQGTPPTPDLASSPATSVTSGAETVLSGHGHSAPRQGPGPSFAPTPRSASPMAPPPIVVDRFVERNVIAPPVATGGMRELSLDCSSGTAPPAATRLLGMPPTRPRRSSSLSSGESSPPSPGVVVRRDSVSLDPVAEGPEYYSRDASEQAACVSQQKACGCRSDCC